MNQPPSESPAGSAPAPIEPAGSVAAMVGLGLSKEEKLRLIAALGELAESGLPLHETVRGLAADLPDRQFRDLLNQFANRVEAGENAHDAIDILLDQADPAVTGLSKAVLRTREPLKTLFRLIDYRRERVAIARQFWLKLLYPVLLLLLTAFLTGIVLRIVSGSIAPMMRGWGIRPPALTEVIFEVADGLGKLGWSGIFLPGLFAMLLLYVAMGGINGILHKWHDLAMLCRTLADLQRADSPLPESLTMCGVMFRGRIGTALEDMAGQVRGGANLADAIDSQRALPDGLGSMVRWSESAGGSSAEGLEAAAALFEARGRGTAGVLASVFTVFAGILVTWVVLLLLVGIYLPVFLFQRMFL